MKRVSAVKIIGSIGLVISMLLNGCTTNSITDNNVSGNDLTATEVIRLMGNGINLGNTLEAYNHKSYVELGVDPTSFETLWGQPVTTRDMIDDMKAMGFDTLRIPVAWTNGINYESGDYTIDERLMNRVDEVVNYALDADMYLEGFTEAECEEIKNSITSEMFTVSSTASNATVKKAAEDYRKNQVKSQLYKLWSDKTGGSKNPRVWSEKHRTPILCCMKDTQYIAAKKVFATLNSSTQSEADIKEALEFLQKADFFDDIASADYRDECFAKHIIGDYTSLISDMNAVRDALESTGISAYEWNDNPSIRSKIDSMANAEYNAGGSDKVVDIIESMDDAELKKWLTDIVRKDMGLGIKIVINKEE